MFIGSPLPEIWHEPIAEKAIVTQVEVLMTQVLVNKPALDQH